MRSSIGVGILGSGPVTQAIHLPALATLPGLFHVERVMDVDAAVAKNVAGRCGATASTDANDVYDDPKVDIVAICSRTRFTPSK